MLKRGNQNSASDSRLPVSTVGLRPIWEARRRTGSTELKEGLAFLGQNPVASRFPDPESGFPFFPPNLNSSVKAENYEAALIPLISAVPPPPSPHSSLSNASSSAREVQTYCSDYGSIYGFSMLEGDLLQFL